MNMALVGMAVAEQHQLLEHEESRMPASSVPNTSAGDSV